MSAKSALATIRGPLAVLALVSFISSVGVGVMLPLMPLYAISLGASPLQLGLMTGLFSLANTVAQLIAGTFLDRVGSLPFVRAGTALYAGANALIATAQDALSLIGFRGLAGLGAGGNLVGSRVYVTQVAPAERMALVNGVLGSAGAAGTVIGPAFGAMVVSVFDLRAPFVIVAVTSGLAFVALLTLPRSAAAAQRREQAPGSAMNRSVMVLLLSNLLLSAGYGGFITTYAPFATQVRAWTALDVGLIFSFAGLGSIVFGAALGQLADRTGRRRIAVVGTIPAALMGVGMVLDFPRALLYAITFLLGGGMAGFMASWFALLNDASPEGRKGRTFGYVSAISNMGTIVGALGASAAWQTLGLPYGFALSTASMLFAGLALLALPAERRIAEARVVVESVGSAGAERVIPDGRTKVSAP